MPNKLEELIDAKAHIESPTFQKFIVKPIKDEITKMKGAYDCESLRELQTLKGKKQGLMFFMKLLKGIEKDYQNAMYDRN